MDARHDRRRPGRLAGRARSVARLVGARTRREAQGAAPRPALVGQAAPVIVGPDPAGASAGRSWDTEAAELVAFLTGGCRTCQVFWAAFEEPAAAGGALGLPVVVVTPSPGTESRRAAAARARHGLPVIMSSEAWTSYGVRGAPWFAVVAGGVVRAEGHAGTWDDLVALAGA